MRVLRLAVFVACGVLIPTASGIAMRRDVPASAEDPSVTTQQRLEALQPVLEKLRGLDPKAFGALSGMLTHASSASLLQRGDDVHEVPPPGAADASDPETARKLEALQPVLEKLRGLDSKTFGVLSNMMAQATGASFLQQGEHDAPRAPWTDLAAPQPVSANKLFSLKMPEVQPVLEKLHALDAKVIRALSYKIAQATRASLLQQGEHDAPGAPWTNPVAPQPVSANKLFSVKMPEVQPVVEKLHALDAKMRGALSNDKVEDQRLRHFERLRRLGAARASAPGGDVTVAAESDAEDDDAPTLQPAAGHRSSLAASRPGPATARPRRR